MSTINLTQLGLLQKKFVINTGIVKDSHHGRMITP